MAEETSEKKPRILDLILVPGLITLAVTILRLVGELQQWSATWFNREMGASVVGITWLPPVFGIYFALKLSARGEGPVSYLRAVGCALLGMIVLAAGAFLPSLFGIRWGFHGRLVYGWLLFAIAALATFRGWPRLFKTLAAYGYAARVPVVVIMFFAFRGNWGTHYDAVPPDFPGMGLVPKFLWLGFFPQLVLWVAFTVLVGMLFGTIAAGIARWWRMEAQASHW